MAQGFALFAGVSPSIVTAAAREAETLGYTSFWVNHPGATDGRLSLAQAASVTRKIDLGIGVIPRHTRGPESIIEGVRCQALPPDRVRLGVGSPSPDSLARRRGGSGPLRAGLWTRRSVGVDPTTTAIAASRADMVAPALAQWRGVVDEVVLRTLPGEDTAEETVTLVRAAAPR